MRSIFAQYGALATPSIETTATPTIGELTCSVSDGNAFVNFSVTNNDTISANVEVSLFSDFTSSATLSIGASSSDFFSLVANNNPPGNVTVYARATASGKAVSTTATRTENLVFCTI
jgi:hypothetical protein